MGLSLDIKISSVHQCTMHIITPIMKIFRFSDRRAAITVFTRTDANSKRKIIGETGRLLVPNTANPSYVGGLNRYCIGVIPLRVAGVS